MTVALPLFVPLPWWTPDDSAAVQEYAAQEAREFPGEVSGETLTPAQEEFLNTLHPRWQEYTCRRCGSWTSEDGARGVCEREVAAWREGYEAPDSTNGFPRIHDTPPVRERCMVGAGSMCEEWWPRSIPEAADER